MVVTLDSVTEESSLLAFIKAQGLKYFERPRSAEHAEISAIIPPPLFGDFLDKAIHEAPENFFCFFYNKKRTRKAWKITCNSPPKQKQKKIIYNGY